MVLRILLPLLLLVSLTQGLIITHKLKDVKENCQQYFSLTGVVGFNPEECDIFIGPMVAALLKYNQNQEVVAFKRFKSTDPSNHVVDLTSLALEKSPALYIVFHGYGQPDGTGFMQIEFFGGVHAEGAVQAHNGAQTALDGVQLAGILKRSGIQHYATKDKPLRIFICSCYGGLNPPHSNSFGHQLAEELVSSRGHGQPAVKYVHVYGVEGESMPTFTNTIFPVAAIHPDKHGPWQIAKIKFMAKFLISKQFPDLGVFKTNAHDNMKNFALALLNDHSPTKAEVLYTKINEVAEQDGFMVSKNTATRFVGKVTKIGKGRLQPEVRVHKDIAVVG